MVGAGFQCARAIELPQQITVFSIPVVPCDLDDISRIDSTGIFQLQRFLKAATMGSTGYDFIGSRIRIVITLKIALDSGPGHTGPDKPTRPGIG